MQLYTPLQVAEGQNYTGGGTGQILASVLIDNLTASWLYIPAAGRSVPPLTFGACFPTTHNAQDTRVLWQTPQGITPPAPGKGQATVIFTDQVLPMSNGTPIANPSQQLPIGKYSGVGAQSLLVVPPPGTNNLIVTFTTNPSSITVTGTQSGVSYFTGTGALYDTPEPGNALFIPINMGQDTSYTVATTGGGTVYITAAFAVQGMQVWLSQPTPNLATIQGKPKTANILGGSAIAIAAPGATIITIPQGSVWFGSIGLVIENVASAAIVSVQVVTAGAGVIPAVGTVLNEVAAISVATGAFTPGVVPNVFVMANGAGAATLAVVTSNAAVIGGRAWAIGVLVGQ